MRVGIYDPYLDDGGGGEKYMLSLAQCLSKDHEVSLFWDDRQDVDRAASRFGIDTTNIGLHENIFSSKVSSAARLFASRKFDCLILLSDGSIPLVASRKLFLHIQQPLPHRVGLKNILKLFRVNQIFCNSTFTKSYVDKRLGCDSLVIYPPVKLNGEKVTKENVILNVGRFRVRRSVNSNFKKQDVLIDAFKSMVDDGLNNWKFILAVSVNDDDEKEFLELKRQAKGYPIEFEVNKTNQELWKSYSKAKIYWHASGFGEDLQKYPEYAEHFGISTVEAMGAGCVPVVINAGGQTEIVEDKVNGILWDTTRELCDETKKLIESPKILESYSIKSALKAKDFSQEKFCREIVALVEC